MKKVLENEALTPDEQKILQEIESLPLEKRKEIERTTLDMAYDRRWCHEKGLSYINPDMKRIAIAVYQELK
jgi:hypothetical protein